MGKNTSVLLGDYFENFINREVSSGRYSSASEVIRTALRMLEAEDQKLAKIRTELEAGENSPMIEKFDQKAFLKGLQIFKFCGFLLFKKSSNLQILCLIFLM